MLSSIAGSLTAYVAAASLLTVTPGLDTALVLRTAASQGARRAALTGLGIAAGCFGWAMLVSLGLGALLAASELGYSILKWAGAAYLIWIGCSMLRHPRSELAERPVHRHSERRAFSTGVLTNLLNPKVGVFYISFLPQFVPPHVQAAPYMLLLGAIHAGLGIIWFAALIAATRPMARLLRRRPVVRWCDRVTGGMFVAFGIGLAVQRRA
jgi:threonine/homoserine/homoserine lactone efflux protein